MGAVVWLGRFGDRFPISTAGSFHIYGARDVRDGGSRVVVVGAPDAERGRVQTALACAHRVHSLLDHPAIPRPIAISSGDETPFLAFDCDAVVSGVELLRKTAASETKLTFASADAFVTHLRRALQAAHSTLDPETGHPICLGQISLANLLFSADGSTWLFGFGRNFPVLRDSGAVDGSTAVFHASEVGAGAPPTPAGDYLALLLLSRSLLPFVALPRALARIAGGDVRPEDAEIFECVAWAEANIIGAPAHARASVEQAAANMDRARRALGETLDDAGFAAAVARLLDGCARAPLVLPVGDVLIGPRALWVEPPDGLRRSLAGRQTICRILLALAQRHVGGGPALAVGDLLAAGWPGERTVGDTGANRVYVAISTLRSLGLRDVLERTCDGYRFVPEGRIRFAPV